MSDLIKASGLWASEDKNGDLVLSGSLGAARVVIFKNGYKEEEKHPDYILYFGARKDDKG